MLLLLLLLLLAGLTEHCLGNMQHIRGAKALRESAGMPELDARVGLVAVQLGLPEDAARLFSSCERWDLVEQLHAASGGWQEALQVATKHDRCVL
jgi:intraflagellar transport protein 140